MERIKDNNKKHTQNDVDKFVTYAEVDYVGLLSKNKQALRNCFNALVVVATVFEKIQPILIFVIVLQLVVFVFMVMNTIEEKHKINRLIDERCKVFESKVRNA